MKVKIKKLELPVGGYGDEPEILSNDCYKQALKEIIEEYTGMEGFITETAPEAYLQSVLKRIYDIAVEAVKINNG
ncbi:MAG: hypothetical protein WC438_05875 [Candidatus Pacearchaeota archaeon]